jgi:osmotically-inducible protein OsmY
MKKPIYVLTVPVLLAFLMSVASAQSAGENKAPAAPKSDEEVRKCITDSFAKGASLKEQKLNVTVSGGIATITGAAKNQGSKGAASRIARKCGAKEVKNEATVENATRPKKKESGAPPKNQ